MLRITSLCLRRAAARGTTAAAAAFSQPPHAVLDRRGPKDWMHPREGENLWLAAEAARDAAAWQRAKDRYHTPILRDEDINMEGGIKCAALPLAPKPNRRRRKTDAARRGATASPLAGRRSTDARLPPDAPPHEGIAPPLPPEKMNAHNGRWTF